MAIRFKKLKNQISFHSLFFYIFFLMLLLAIIGLLIYSNLKINQKRKEFKSQSEALKKEFQILEEKNQQLRSKISESQKENYLEKEAREKLELKKPGEEVVIVLLSEEKEKEKENEKENEQKQEKKSFWQRWWNKIIGQ